MISFSFLYGIRPRTASGMLRHVFLSAAARLRRAGSKGMRQHRMHIAHAEKMFSDYIYCAGLFSQYIGSLNECEGAYSRYVTEHER